MNMKLKSFSKALASAALFGIATPFSKSLLADLQENQLAGFLYLGAAICLFPIVVRQRRNGAALFPTSRKNRLLLLGAIFFGGVLGPVLLLLGLKYALAASVSMWLNLETVATAVLAVLLFKEHLGKWAWIGNIGIFAAGVLLGFSGGWAGLIGMLFVGGAAIAWGLDNNFTACIDGISPEVSTFWKGLFAGTLNLSIGLLLFPLEAGAQWPWALVLGGISYGASIALYISAAQHLGAARSQMVFSSAPFFGVLLCLIWLGEGMNLLQVVAGVVLVGAIAALFIDRHAHEHKHDILAHDHLHRHGDEHHNHEHQPDAAATHSHGHKHESLVHTHPHWPDLHHRHNH